MVTVKFADGKSIQAPARGKVLKSDIRLTMEQIVELQDANLEAQKQPLHVESERKVVDNSEYYNSLPKYYNYNKKGEIVNQFKTKDEWFKSFKRRK